MAKATIGRLFRDPHTRGALFLVGGMTFHFLYGAFRLILGILYGKYRTDVAAFFYLSLALARLFLLRAYREGGEEEEMHACRLAGRMLFFSACIMLLLLSEALSGRVRGYPFYALIVSGGYALSAVALSIAELWYLKRLSSPALSASRVVGLASALLSSVFFVSDVVDSVALFPGPLKGALRLAVSGVAVLFVFVLATGLSWRKGHSG